jgi:hypothetical protein
VQIKSIMEERNSLIRCPLTMMILLLIPGLWGCLKGGRDGCVSFFFLSCWQEFVEFYRSQYVSAKRGGDVGFCGKPWVRLCEGGTVVCLGFVNRFLLGSMWDKSSFEGLACWEPGISLKHARQILSAQYDFVQVVLYVLVSCPNILKHDVCDWDGIFALLYSYSTSIYWCAWRATPQSGQIKSSTVYSTNSTSSRTHLVGFGVVLCSWTVAVAAPLAGERDEQWCFLHILYYGVLRTST